MVSNVDGAALLAGLPSIVTINGSNPVEVLTDNADIMAGFSSRGPAPFLGNLKPDVTAPGAYIYSSAFDEATGELGWAMMQGTSMAAPHVTGAAALLLAQDGGLTLADVKSKLGNNAERTNLSGDARSMTILENSAYLTAPDSVDVPAGGTATFDVTVKARGAVEEEGDLTITSGGATCLVPYYFSTGN